MKHFGNTYSKENKVFRHPHNNHTKMATASSPRVDGSSSNSDSSGSTNDGNAISAVVSAVRTMHSTFRASLAAKPINKVRGHFFVSLSLAAQLMFCFLVQDSLLFHYIPACSCVSYGALSLAVINPKLVRNVNRR